MEAELGTVKLPPKLPLDHLILAVEGTIVELSNLMYGEFAANHCPACWNNPLIPHALDDGS